MAIMARASAKTKAMIIAVKTLGALEGFLAKASILAKLLTAKTAQGPKMHKPKIITKAIVRLIVLRLVTTYFFYQYGDFVLVNLHYSPFYEECPVIDKQLTGNKTAHQAFMKR
jgi:hypothetical protein